MHQNLDYLVVATYHAPFQDTKQKMPKVNPKGACTHVHGKIQQIRNYKIIISLLVLPSTHAPCAYAVRRV